MLSLPDWVVVFEDGGGIGIHSFDRESPAPGRDAPWADRWALSFGDDARAAICHGKPKAAKRVVVLNPSNR